MLQRKLGLVLAALEAGNVGAAIAELYLIAWALQGSQTGAFQELSVIVTEAIIYLGIGGNPKELIEDFKTIKSAIDQIAEVRAKDEKKVAVN